MARLDRYWDGKWVTSLVVGKREYLVGRDPECDLVLEDSLASRRHFSLTWDEKDGVYALQDLETSNGTIINGVKEFRCKLRNKSAIQVGQEFLLFLPDESREEPPEEDGIPAWAKREEGDPMRFGGEPTGLISPAALNRMQARVRARSRPHLLLRLEEETMVFSLDTSVTPIGYGPLRASLGPWKAGKEKILAEVIRTPIGEYKIKAKGFFARVEVDGRLVKEAVLKGDEELVVGDMVLEFHKGLRGRETEPEQ